MGSRSQCTKRSRRRQRLGAVALIGVVTVVAHLPAQSPSPAPFYTPGTMQYPQTMKPWSDKMALGASLISMPSAIALDGSTIHWPLLVYENTLGLPAHFTLATTFSTEIITNHVEVMPRWQVALSPRWHGDLGLGVAYCFGRMTVDNFDNRINGWFAYPQVGLGYDWGKLALTFQAKADWIMSLHTQSGGLIADYSKNWLSGSSFRLILEQPIWKHTTLGFGLQANYLKFYYPQWPLFPTLDHHFWIPEAQLYFTL